MKENDLTRTGTDEVEGNLYTIGQVANLMRTTSRDEDRLSLQIISATFGFFKCREVQDIGKPSN